MDFMIRNGLTIHYALQGTGDGIPLVFVNALGTDLRIWDGVVPHLMDYHPLLRFDKRGHGLSDCPPAPYTIHDFSTDLLRLLEQLEISQAILVGISVGGMVAMDFAASWPERVYSMVLCDTAPVIGTADLWNDRINKLREHGMEFMAESILARWFLPAFKEKSPAVYQGYYNMLTRMPVEGYTGTCEAIRDADLTEAARTIRVPTLILCGTEDVSTPPGLVSGLVDLMPDADYQEIPGAGHSTCIEQPDAVARQIARFLRTSFANKAKIA
jgi:3-oxoadipate enol-lactonase